MLKENKIKQDIVFLKNFKILKFGETNLKKFYRLHKKKIYGAAAAATILGVGAIIKFNKKKQLPPPDQVFDKTPLPNEPPVFIPKSSKKNWSPFNLIYNLFKKDNNNFEIFQNCLTALYYTDYENINLRDQFYNFYDPLFFDIIDKHHKIKNKNKKNLNKTKNEARIQFINFLDRNHEHCVISNQEIEIENYGNENAKVSLINKKKFDEDIGNCLTTNKTNTTGFIYLHDKNMKNHGNHQNTFIISPTKHKFWRLEPNFAIDWQENSVKKQFCEDNLEKGEYDLDMYQHKATNIEEICNTPDKEGKLVNNHISLKDFCTKVKTKYYDFPNKALNDYFKDFPLKIKDEIFKFSGYYPYALNTCPNHGGLCAVISTLQSQLSRVLQPRDIKFYLINFFKDQLREIYDLNYDININTNNKLTQLLNFLKTNYGQNNTVYKIDGTSYTNDQINSLNLTNTVNKI